jgi:hypothetical protein
MSYSYQSAFRQALLELERLLTQKDGLERRVSDLKTALPLLAKLARPSKQEQAAMAELIGAAETGSISLTRAVRLALAMAQKPLTTVEIRDRLVERGFEFSCYSNPMAAIHSAVNRMMAVAEITAATGEGERPAYSAVKGVVRAIAVKDRAELKKAMDLLAGKSEERNQA